MSAAYRHTISPTARPEGYGAVLPAARAAAEALAADAQAGRLHALTIAEDSSDLTPARAAALRIRESAEHVVILGVGGSSLGAQAIAQLKGFATPLESLGAGPRLHFLDNLDGPSMSGLLDTLALERTHFVSISKSGTTAETMMQTLAALAALEKRGIAAGAGKAFTIVTERKASPLSRLAQERGIACLDHPLDIGGRFSVLSIVGLLPALVLGLDAGAIRAGAATVIAQTRRGESPAIEGAAFAVAAAQRRPIHVLMAYGDRLERLAAWYRQLWAESLGKDGKGTYPVPALGPVDQHSQLQLYLAGPPLAAFSVMSIDQSGRGPAIPRGASHDPALSYLEGKSIGDLAMAEARASYETLEAHRLPCRRIEIPNYDEFALGALFMHFMIETILAASLFKVDAFDQPAVEEGKVLARRYMDELKR